MPLTLLPLTEGRRSIAARGVLTFTSYLVNFFTFKEEINCEPAQELGEMSWKRGAHKRLREHG